MVHKSLDLWGLVALRIESVRPLLAYFTRNFSYPKTSFHKKNNYENDFNLLSRQEASRVSHRLQPQKNFSPAQALLRNRPPRATAGPMKQIPPHRDPTAKAEGQLTIILFSHFKNSGFSAIWQIFLHIRDLYFIHEAERQRKSTCRVVFFECKM